MPEKKGEAAAEGLSYKDAIARALRDEMRADPRVLLIGEDVGVYGGAFGVSEGLLAEFGEDRVRDTPISEAGITGVAVGAAMTGLRPVVEIMFADFVTLAMDMLVNQAAKMRFMFGAQCAVPMVVRTAGGAGTGAGAQHSQCIESWLCNVPGLKVVCPSNAADAYLLLREAIRDDNPVVFLEQKALYNSPWTGNRDATDAPLGKARSFRDGTEAVIISYGRTVPLCVEASEVLHREGISAGVLDLRTLVPLDRDAVVAEAEKTGRVLIVHEAPVAGGFGAEVAAAVAESATALKLRSPVRRLGGPWLPVPFGKLAEEAILPTVEGIAAAVREMVGKR